MRAVRGNNPTIRKSRGSCQTRSPRPRHHRFPQASRSIARTSVDTRGRRGRRKTTLAACIGGFCHHPGQATDTQYRDNQSHDDSPRHDRNPQRASLTARRTDTRKLISGGNPAGRIPRDKRVFPMWTRCIRPEVPDGAPWKTGQSLPEAKDLAKIQDTSVDPSQTIPQAT